MYRYQGFEIATLADLDTAQKAVLLRVDFNVPINSAGGVEDTARIEAALPTLARLLEKNAKVLIMSHLGRPKGRPEQRYSLEPVASVLAQRLNRPVLFVEDPLSAGGRSAITAQPLGSVTLFENVRFWPAEEANDAAWAKYFRDLAEVFVNDAFGVMHRAHASTDALPRLFDQKAMGLLVEQELDYFHGRLKTPQRPFAVVLGGAKVSDKIKVIEALLKKADFLFIGGAMAYTFALAQGRAVGSSLCEPDCVSVAQRVMAAAKEQAVELFLPTDTLITDRLDFTQRSVGTLKVAEGDIPEDWEGVDIGPKTIERYTAKLQQAKTILWNGPMGVFEIPACAKGTLAMAAAIEATGALTIVGGGDSLSAARQSQCQFSFMSTGGGASLALLEERILPGLLALKG